jgi:hypothetical protein
VSDETWSRPKVALLLCQQMPTKNSQLARHGNGGNLMAASNKV